VQQRLAELERQWATNAGNARLVFDLASVYLQVQRTNAALELFDQLLDRPETDVNTVLSVANAFAQLQQGPRLETALLKLVKLTPESPEAWYDLASTQAILNKPNDALAALRQALELSTRRLSQQTNARDLRADALTNRSFTALRGLPEFQKLVGGP
jgi:tetratricopeptide (TPR) repeat protein